MEKRIKEIIAKQLVVKNEEVTPEARLIEDLDGDSLDHIELIMELEKEFGVEISDEEADPCKTVKQVIELVEKKIQ